jgi:hypothetical protein
MYGYQPSIRADRLPPLAGVATDTYSRLHVIADIRNVVKQYLNLAKERVTTMSTRIALLFQLRDLVYFSTKGLHIRSHKYKHLRDQTSGPFKVISKVGVNYYKMLLCKGCRLHPLFRYDLSCHASTSTSHRPHQTYVEDDYVEYPMHFIYDVKIDNWSRRSGSYLPFLEHFVSFDIPK